MTYISYYKQDKRRSKTLAGRPEWQDLIPDTSEQRALYRIADNHIDRFSRAFLAMTRSIIDDDTAKLVQAAWNRGDSPQSIVNLIPIFAEGINDEDPVWKKFIDKIEAAYFDLIEESGKDEAKRINRTLKTNIGFTMEPVKSDVEIIKAKKVPVVPVNPFSIEWMRERSLELIKTALSKSQRDVVKEVLVNAINSNLRGKEVIDSIRANIGLTGRDLKAVGKRTALLTEAKIPVAQRIKQIDKYRSGLIKNRAQMIARTETIAAQAHGRNTTWQLANESGQLKEVTRVWITAPSSPNPNRPCEICEDLDGAEAKLGEPYESAFIGLIQMPPAHPSCRCTETLIRI